MVNFQKHTLDNGLTVIAHGDDSTPMVTVNMLYKVGSRNEHPRRTGFAHLFEHLMFGGSANAPQYDRHVQLAGGECNAFTTADFTSYYVTLPAQNIETALWLESDRLLNPLLNEETLRVQQQVVVEEFNQRYLNQPYGDVSLLLRPLAYKVHPYRWHTIGKTIDHIATATLSDVRAFFAKFYAPNNAVLAIGGNISPDRALALAQKWFADIPRGAAPEGSIAPEPPQAAPRSLSVARSVPAAAIFKACHMPHRLHPDYHACDLITDILAGGKSSRLYRRMVQQEQLFGSISAHISGDMDAGLLTVSGYLLPQTDMQRAEAAIDSELQRLCTEDIPEYELEKVKNKMESLHVFAEATAMQKAIALACAEMIGDANLVNTDIESYRRIATADIRRVAGSIFRKENTSTLYYYSSSHSDGSDA
ncbi:MAG: insulinase family protein [Prevotellaceae bacterium]|jgi:predicted Zn-dependent peptidase|nr:insulinase family protein [Prevotellaceae bacterium]